MIIAVSHLVGVCMALTIVRNEVWGGWGGGRNMRARNSRASEREYNARGDGRRRRVRGGEATDDVILVRVSVRIGRAIRRWGGFTLR